jgi:cyanophycin synthetase
VPSAAGLEEFYITEDEQMFNIVRTQVDVVLSTGVAVINAHEPAAAELADLCDGEVIYFATDAHLTAVQDHRAQGGRVVLCQEGQLLLVTGDQERPLFDQRQPAPLCNSSAHTPVLLAAVATAWALGLPLSVIRAGIETDLFSRATAV